MLVRIVVHRGRNIDSVLGAHVVVQASKKFLTVAVACFQKAEVVSNSTQIGRKKILLNIYRYRVEISGGKGKVGRIKGPALSGIGG